MGKKDGGIGVRVDGEGTRKDGNGKDEERGGRVDEEEWKDRGMKERGVMDGRIRGKMEG